MALDRLSADDRMILWPDAVWPQDVGALVLLDGANLLTPHGGFRLDLVREAIASRLHLLPHFRQVLHEPGRGLGGPLWVDCPTFDIRRHVRVVPVPPSRDEAQLLGMVEELRSRRLDRSRPLWEMWFLTGLPDGQIGLFLRWHHVLADGIAGIAAIGALLDTTPEAVHAAPPAWVPQPWPTTAELLRDNVRARVLGVARLVARLAHPVAAIRHLRRGWPALRELMASEPGPVTSLGRLIGPDRRLAMVRSTLPAVQGVAHRHGATINDVLLTATAGGVRQLLCSRGERVAGLSVPIYVPVSLRLRGGSREGGNLITQMVIPLPVDQADPEQRLRAIANATATRKSLQRESLGGMFHNKLLAAITLKLVARQRVNIVSADLPGPTVPLYLAGARLLEVFPVVNLIGTISLGVAAVSYAGTFTIMVVADADAYPDLEVLTTGIRAELEALVPVHTTAALL